MVINYLRKNGSGIPTVEEVQDAVEKVLIETGHAKTAKAYILYRDRRTRLRESKSELMDVVEEILVETSRENANVSNSPSAKMLQIASAASKRYYLSRLIPEELSAAHRDGDIHIHDLDFYGKTLTCVQIPLGRLLAEGFDTGHGYIRPPNVLRLPRPWLRLFCRVPRMICMVASPSPSLIGTWRPLWRVRARMRFTRRWRL